MASVRERSPGRWQVRAWVGRDPLTGRDDYRTRTIDAASRREAQRRGDRWEDELREGELSGESGTMGQLFDAWLQVRARRWAPSTARSNRAKVDRYLRRPLGHMRVDQVRTQHLDRIYGELADRGGRCTRDVPCAESPCDHGAPLSTATVVRLHAIVSGALSQAVAWGWIARSPAERAEPGQVVTDEIDPPPASRVVTLLATAEEAIEPAFAVYLALAIESGARRGALLALRWSDWVEHDDGTSLIRMRRVLSIGPDGVVERPASRTKRTGRATLGPHVTAALAGHRARMWSRALEAGAPLTDEAHLFSDDVMGEIPWHPDTASHRWGRVRARVGLDGARLHDLRHLMATSLLSSGTSPSVVASRGGWGQLATMLGRYAHSLPADDQAAAGILDRLITPPD